MLRPRNLLATIALLSWGAFSAWMLGRYAEAYPHLVTWPSHLATSARDCFTGEHRHLFGNWWLMLRQLASFALMIGVVASLGALIQRAAPPRELGSRDRALECLGLGAVTLHFLMFAGGLAGLWYPALILLGAAIAILPGAWLWLGAGRPLPSLRLRLPAWYLIAFALILLAALECSAPATGGDGGLYHVGVPSTWLADHRIHFLRERYVANLPLPQSMFFAFLLAVGPPDASMLFQPALLMLAAVTMSATVARYVERPIFPLEIFAILAVPALNGYLAVSGNDQLTIAFFALGLHFGLIAIEQDRRGPDVRQFVVALGFVGFGMSAKFTAVAHGLLLAAFLSLLWWRRGGSLRAVAIALLAFGLPASAWAAKAWLYTGNPLYPAMADVFDTRHLYPEGIEVAFASNVPRIHGGWEHLTFAYQTAVGAPGLMHNGGPHWLILTPLLLFAGWRVVKDRKTFLLAVAFMIAGWVTWALSYMSARYSAPLFTVMAVAMSVVFNRWLSLPGGLRRLRRFRRLALGLTAALMLWIIAMAWSYRHDNVRPYTFLCGRFDPLGYVSDQDLKMTLSPEQPLVHFLNTHLDRDQDRVLLIGEDRTAGLEIPHLAGTRYDHPIFERYVATASTAAEVREELRRDGVTHLAVNLGLGAFFESVGHHILTLPPRRQALWSAFASRWIDIVEHQKEGEHDWAVLRLRDTPAAEPRPDFVEEARRSASH